MQQVAGAAAGEPRIAGPITYIKPRQQGRQLQAKEEASAAAKAAAADSQPARDPAVGSWWVQDASEKHAAAGPQATETAAGKQKAAKAEGEKVGHIEYRKHAQPVSMEFPHPWMRLATVLTEAILSPARSHGTSLLADSRTSAGKGCLLKRQGLGQGDEC